METIGGSFNWIQDFILSASSYNGYRTKLSQLLLVLSGDVELNPGPLNEDEVIGADVDTTPLDTDDLADVLTELEPVESRFYEIGIMLHLRPDVLEGIRDLNPVSSSRGMSKMITEWLKRNYNTKRFGYPTWKSLVIAVAKRCGGANEACARDIATKHRVPIHSSQVKTSTEEVKSKLFTEDNANSDAIPVHSTIKEQSFPYLKAENLTTEQRKGLIAELTIESEDMRSKFATLVSLTNKSLQNNKVSVSELTVTFKNIDLDELVEILEDETDMNKAMLKASDFWSFFDYEIVKSIISTHCADLQQKVESYESDFKTYCERRLCEVPVDSLKADIPSKIIPLKTSNLHVKIDEDFKIKLCKIKRIEARLSHLLDKRLYLLKVEDGCIELVFNYFGRIKLSLPLNSQQEEELSEMGVLRLYDDNHEYYRAPTQVRSPSPSSQQSQLPSANQLSSNTLSTGGSDDPSEIPRLSLLLNLYSLKPGSTVSDNYKGSDSGYRTGPYSTTHTDSEMASDPDGRRSSRDFNYPAIIQDTMENELSPDVEGNRWVVRASRESHDCVNPVRSCEEVYFVDAMAKRDVNKSLIKLSIGDPSVFGNLPPPPAAYEGVKQAVDSGKYNGYGHSSGLYDARDTVAKQFSTQDCPLKAEDVVMTHSGSGALLMALEVLCDPGSSILIPTPGFGLYKCQADARGVKTKFYKLLPERGWEIDLEDLERNIDDTVSAILVNNPSNPCGSVYSRQHLLHLLQVLEKHRLPIISDDIYHGMVFPGQEFVPLTSLSKNVPILSCGGISKLFMVPGWRLGWIIIHDRNHAFKTEVIPGLTRLAMKLLGPCTLVQAGLSHTYQNTPQEYHDRNMRIIQRNAILVYEGLMKAPGITPVMPAGSMYMMVTVNLKEFPKFDTDVEFTKQLLIEEGVFCIPGKAFIATECFRVVLMMPDKKISEALDRITQFCRRYHVPEGTDHITSQ